jgi:hypothetical protein
MALEKNSMPATIHFTDDNEVESDSSRLRNPTPKR